MPAVESDPRAVDELVGDDLRALAARHDHPRLAPGTGLRGHQPAPPSMTAVVERSAALAAAAAVWRPIYVARVARAWTGAAALVAAAIAGGLLHAPAFRDGTGAIAGIAVVLLAIYGAALPIAGRRFDTVAIDAIAIDPRALTWLDRGATTAALAGLFALGPVIALLGKSRFAWDPAHATRVGDLVFGPYLAIAAALAVPIAIAVQRAIVRRGTVACAVPRNLMAVGMFLGVMTLGLTVKATAALRPDVAPAGLAQVGLALLGHAAVVMVATGLVLHVRQREHASLATIAP